MKVFFYIKNNEVIYFKNNEEGKISLNKIEDFINENRKSTYYLIFSKLNYYFRKLEFNFRDRKKINLILSQELDGKLPKPLDNFIFTFNFIIPKRIKHLLMFLHLKKKR